ncbi:MAG: LamG-like jellyroll fold domain-containing protein [bacterium]
MKTKLLLNRGFVKKLNAVLVFIILSILATPAILLGQGESWHKVGEPGFSNDTNELDGTVGPDGSLYVVSNQAGGGAFEVFKFNGSHWESLGGPSESYGNEFSIKIASDGTIYVGTLTGFGGDMGWVYGRVYKYSANSWSEIIDGIPLGSSGGEYPLEIILGSDGYPFLFHRSLSYNELNIKKYTGTGTTWTDIGTISGYGDLNNESFALASDNTPYVFFRYNNGENRAKVIKHNGSAWVDVGTVAAGDRVADVQTGIALNSTNVPYIFFKDNDNSGKGTVLQYDGSNWVTVGSAGFTAGAADHNFIRFTNDVPYVFYKDAGTSNKATVMKYNGSSWENVGSAGFSSGTVDYISGAFTFPNAVTVPVAFYKDNNAGGKKSVMKFSQKNITVTSPNGGEYYKTNSAQSITWTSNDVSNVKIEYSTNNGTSWNTIVASTPAAAGTYPWVTPNGEYIQQCRVKVSDVNNPSLVIYSDGSDAVFSVSPYIVKGVGSGTSTYDYLPINTQAVYSYTQQIYTQAQLNFSGQIKKLEFTNDGSPSNNNSWDVYIGITSKTTFDSNSDWIPVGSMTKVFSGDVTFPSNGGSIFVTLPSTFTYSNTDNLVIAVHEKSDGQGYSTSWGSFTSGDNTGLVSYNHTSGTPIDPASPPAANWRTSSINRINFHYDNPVSSITVASPNGGENWVVGSSKNITWGYNLVDNVKIEYTTDGTTWNTLIASTPASATSYSWTIPNEISANCKVRVSDASNAALNDESNAVFSIIAPFVTVTAPNGGESWNIGTAHNITWTSDGVTNVKLEYSTTGGAPWNSIIASTAASAGTYSWTIPNAPTTNCLVKVSEATTGTPNDQSNAVFTIPPPTITVTAPNGGEIYGTGSSQNITWTSIGLSNVKIEYSTNNGSDWIEISASADASLGTFPWTVPNTPSTNCLVKISDLDGTPSDQSNSRFTITTGTIRVKTPNGGESWAASTKNSITWTSVNVDNIKIEYTTNNGGEWIEIIASTPAAAGSYQWTVPNTPASSCKVRISNVDNVAIIDASNKTFTIEAAPPAPAHSGEWAVQFDGTDDHISFASTPAYNNAAITVEAWINSTSAADEKVIVSWGNSGGQNNVQFRMQGGKLQFGMDAGGWVSVIGTTSINTGKWVHVAVVKSGQTATLLINGKWENSYSSFSGNPSVNTCRIGVQYYNGTMPSQTYFVGNIDEVRIWNTARSAAQIKANMYRHLTGTETGLVSYYNMNDGSGTTVTDSQTGGAYPGTLENGPLWKSSGCFAGPINTLLFDGSDDFIYVPDANSLDLTENYTLESWINATTFKSAGGIISKTATASNGYYLRLSSTGSYNDLYFDGMFTTGLNLQAGVWYHVAAVKSGATRKLYVNGKEVSLTGTPQNVAVNSNQLRIGDYANFYYFHGMIDEVRIWNVARTPEQIQESMMNTLTGSETGLALYFRNDYYEGTTTYDLSPNANNGTLYFFTAPGCWVSATPYNTWLGVVDGSWSTAANWSLGTVPSATDNVGLFYWGAGGNECTVSTTPTVKNLFISPSSNPTLGSDFVVNGSLVLQRDIDLSGRTITLGSSGYLNEGTHRFFGTSGSITITRTLNNISNENVGGLGFVITSAANLGSTIITRGHTVQTSGENEGISRFYNVTPTTNTGLDATVTYYYNEAELNDIEEANLVLFRSVDDGATWVNVGGNVSAENNTVTLSPVDGFSKWTLGGSNAPLPVELTSFTASVSDKNVILNWQTATEVNNYGFEVERKISLNPPLVKGDAASAEGDWRTLGFVEGNGNSNSVKEYSFVDNNITGGNYSYRLKQIDTDGSYSYSEAIEVTCKFLPTAFELYQNYPNPFNPSTTIKFGLPEDSRVTLELFNILGERVATLINQEMSAGYHNYQLSIDNYHLSSGMYIYRIIAGEFVQTKKLLLLK